MEEYGICWTTQAQTDFITCLSFVMFASKEAADNLKKDLSNAILSLKTFPERYPVFEMPKYAIITMRKLIVNKRYVILYSIEDENIFIYRIIDSRRNFERLI